jgi:hypothetical protein
VAITKENTRAPLSWGQSNKAAKKPPQLGYQGAEGPPPREEPAGRSHERSEDAGRRFREAVDLYHRRRYSESLTIFDALSERYPDNNDVQTGRSLCLRALERERNLLHTPSDLADELNEKTVRRFLLEKMLHGETDEIQLQAARMACEVLGLFSRNGIPDPQAPPGEE